eukprot:6388694-Amphidinium_carterae.1
MSLRSTRPLHHLRDLCQTCARPVSSPMDNALKKPSMELTDRSLRGDYQLFNLAFNFWQSRTSRAG